MRECIHRVAQVLAHARLVVRDESTARSATAGSSNSNSNRGNDHVQGTVGGGASFCSVASEGQASFTASQDQRPLSSACLANGLRLAVEEKTFSLNKWFNLNLREMWSLREEVEMHLQKAENGQKWMKGWPFFLNVVLFHRSSSGGQHSPLSPCDLFYCALSL